MTEHFLFPPQREVLDFGLLESGFNCVLQMPTGSGKTWLAEQAIASALDRGFRAIYLTPLRALASELETKWTARFSGHAVRSFTGEKTSASPDQLERTQLLIMTPERLDACTRNWRSHWEWIPDVDLLVVDEFHLLGDSNRGARLEGTMSRFQRLNPFARVLALSATLGNREELADWLGGVEYVSTWRSVPLDWRVCRFKKVDEKLPILVREIERCACAGGRSLVFVQSRRRAEQIAAHLAENGLASKHHHAGLDSHVRNDTESDFRAGGIDVLVSTGTLEMGLNLPVRQVVLYDVQSFNGGEYVPLTTNTVWQRAGRAGRHGLDDHGEVVLIAPAWDRHADNYLRGNFEPVKSQLLTTTHLAEQVLAEVGSGLSRTQAALKRTFGSSLAATQRRLPNVDAALNQMLAAGMLVESQTEGRRPALKATRLGRIAVRQLLAPETIIQLARHLLAHAANELSLFDLLLIASSTPDCEPQLVVDFEELESLTDALQQQRTSLLASGQSTSGLWRGRRLVRAIKTALIAWAWTSKADSEAVAESFNCYPFEVRRLTESLERILTAMTAVVSDPDEAIDRTPTANRPLDVRDRIVALRSMVTGGLDEETVTLTFIPGIGAKLAKRLLTHGVKHAEDLAASEVSDLAAQKGISATRAEKWIQAARDIVKRIDFDELNGTFSSATLASSIWPTGIDPYRLARARELRVERLDDSTIRVTGGTEPHLVAGRPDGLQCDCPDHAKGNTCKHILAVRLDSGDESLSSALHNLRCEVTHSATLDLHQLWFDTREERDGISPA